jgi:hypothetical protein
MRYALSSFVLFACAAESGMKPCTVTSAADGSATISCPDGTTATVPPGAPGATGSDGTSGTDGRSCTVAESAGTKTISCDDGTSVTVSDGTSCSVTDNGDNTLTFSCDDGTSTTVPAGSAIDARATMTGTVRLYGATDHSGITVSVDGTSIETTTDAAGRYAPFAIDSTIERVQAYNMLTHERGYVGTNVSYNVLNAPANRWFTRSMQNGRGQLARLRPGEVVPSVYDDDVTRAGAVEGGVVLYTVMSPTYPGELDNGLYRLDP